MLEYQPLLYVVNSSLDTDWTDPATSPALMTCELLEIACVCVCVLSMFMGFMCCYFHFRVCVSTCVPILVGRGDYAC